MALPVVRALADCASYAKTVEPYIGELTRLPHDVVAAVNAAVSGTGAGSGPAFGGHAAGLVPLLQLYLHTNPLVWGFATSVVLGAVFFVVSEVNGNYSQVDRCWSLLPTMYIAHFDLWARLAGVPSARLDAALLASTVWSLRLTYNYARKGGYNVGSEDYRWEIVRKAIPGWLFHLLNLTFIAFFQSILLFLLAAPAYTLLLTSTVAPELAAADVAFVAAELGLVLLEWVADQQQWTYQAAKRAYQATAKVPPGCGYDQAALDRGFVAEGLWAHSRHPNFAAEQSVWIALYQWSCCASSRLYSWAGVGAAVLVLLFQGSTALTERITSSKYPDYRAYQSQVARFVPTRLAGFTASTATTATTARRAPTARRASTANAAAQKQADKEARASGRQTTTGSVSKR